MIRRRLSALLAPPFVHSAPRHRILVLPDGNGRGPTGGDYEAGGRKMIEVARHLASLGTVASMYFCLLSPENVEKRDEAFFEKLARAFVWLRRGIEESGLLVRDRIGMRIKGRLHRLAARGEQARAAASAITAACEAARIDGAPALWVDVAVDYPADAPEREGIHLIFRTGMEEEGVARLSGLIPGPESAIVGTPTLWPRIETPEIDAAIASLHAGRARFDGSPSIELWEESLRALLDGPEAPCSIEISGECEGGAGALARRLQSSGYSLIYPEDPLGLADARSPFFATRSAAREPVLVRVAPPALAGSRPTPSGVSPVVTREIDCVLLPGQQGALRVPPGLAPGYSNLFGCPADGPGVASAIRRAAQFMCAHPALHGGPRTPAAPSAGAVSAPEAFARRMVDWAKESGLWPADPESQRAMENYALTAWGTVGPGRSANRALLEADETTRGLLARYMVVVAAGDDGVFDRRGAAFDQASHAARAARAAREIKDALRSRGGGHSEDPLVASIIRALLGMLASVHGRAHPLSEELFRRGLADMYSANAAEQDPSLIPALVTGLPRTGPSGRRARRHTLASAREAVRAYLERTGASVGAGQLFRTAALAARTAEVTPRRIHYLDRTAVALDASVRLANDIAGARDFEGADRDSKETCVTLFMRIRGVDRAEAIARCREMKAEADDVVAGEFAALLFCWPEMGRLFARGAFIGEHVYATTHFARASRAEMLAVLSAADRAPLPGSRAMEREIVSSSY